MINSVMFFFIFAGPQGIVTSNHIKSLLFAIVCGQIPSLEELSRVTGYSCDQTAENSGHFFPASRQFRTSPDQRRADGS